MFDKVNKAIGDIRRANQLRQEERERAEHERIQQAKNALMQLSEKQLIVELVYSLYETRISLAEIKEEIESIKINQTLDK